MNHIAPGRNAGVYSYDDIDRRFVAERVEQFRAQVERRLSGELTEDEFKPLRLMNGLYLQLHAYMLRIAVPYGVLTARQLRKLAEIGRKYDKGYGHFTTRQNLQFNWIKLEDTPAILHELAEVDMHALQTSGNCVRNVTTDQFVGAARDEVVDGRVYAEILRQWTTLHPEFTFLPRKFKIAIMGSDADRAAIRVHDVGVFAKRNERGEVGFTFYVGGGLGRSPFIGKLIRDWVPEEDFVAYLEAILRVYNQYGRRDNIYKARIKILVHELGQEKFTQEVEEEFARLRGPKYRLAPEVVDEIRRRFGGPAYETLTDEPESFQAAKAANPDFARWVAVNVLAHKVPGYAAATISLKPAGGIPGDATSEQMELIADLADAHSFGELRVSHAQNLVLAHVRQDELFTLWTALEANGLGTPNAGLIGDIIACPGLDYCALANARSIPLAQAISARFADPARQQTIGELGIKISGCINACGHHHVGAIGILGVDKKGEEFYQITVGGDPTLTTAIGDILGPAVTADETVDAIEAIVEVYLSNRHDGERFIDTLKRVGHGPFKERVYAAH
ncbi:sulfite reductase [Azospirillum argentinense]|uniref:Sulfite reductase n=2 Tax=Azospirillum TaxID=191 RepID=A0A5B0L3L0_9PROT|nr:MULTISPECIES: nitrite/sulfite reductase [Azospirillum]AIB11568.1 sulfite reductase [Azospirillum argentinense]AWJ82714.1 sulfite reductase [Azospirillum sp. TSH58]EZQ08479.1 sulfite reductase [Azospirillum argentinense]KAA1058895.1 Sulfite reductase [NADPH] hemoprotein beta-component [Azospirillum argentinense]MBK3799895.1 nitrite/sulfite reductase [Azospirillum argentinense]